MLSTIMMIAAGTHKAVHGPGGSIVAVEPVQKRADWMCRNCGHSPIWHVGCHLPSLALCRFENCQCKVFSSLSQDLLDAERHYAEQVDMMKERSPA